MPHTTLSVAVCICDDTTLTDFIPPCEIMSSANFAETPLFPEHLQAEVTYRFRFEFIAPSMRPIAAVFMPFGPSINPTKTYNDALKEGYQYDIIWVPAGPMPNMITKTDRTPQIELDFIKAQAPKAKYILSVCGGSIILAMAGVLSGKRATSNKLFFRVAEEISPKDITWVPVARWVVDGNVWTSSGVTSGIDMTLAFMEHLMGRSVAQHMRSQVEVIEHKQDEDPFGVYSALLDTV
ncbi:class I glutamine amidotransferase-like protein [Cylindrobasidium torrendii FP15055 ss-10]|uniref:Class I glutamine amidotransferase-like protein n=1 Tax=Cylindrobasidium torrendii FP15055 ss-10 TaxID=1314674 RepID=A0A0D7B4N5_9AGAR|nr:class I glutamine amidotransferase-like protein [Cylindrobasidium torrendii FP15055 ss-10]